MTPAALLALRDRLGLSQKEMAELLGFTGEHRDDTLRLYEQGKRPIPERVALRVEKLEREMVG